METVVKPLVEAPFGEYLKILRENGHEEDATISEQFYVELLTTPFEDGSSYTKEQVYKIPFKDIYAMAEKIISSTYQEVTKIATPMTFTGTMMTGPDAEKIPPEQLDILARRQAQMIEDEKERLRLA